MVRMKRFRIILLYSVIAMSLLFSGTAYAQSEELPNPGITPDSPLYFVDVLAKKVGLFFTFGDEAKAKKALEITEERLAEARVMAVKNKPEALKMATSGYNEYLAIAIERMNKAKKKDISDNISEAVAVATSKHLLVLDEVADIAPKEATEAIAKTKEVSINGQGTALRLLARKNARKAIQINLASAEGRLNRVKVKVEEMKVKEVEVALGEFERLNKFGEEISQIARGLSANTTDNATTVDQLVAEATSSHLEVLARVYEKVPEQVKPAIERAMTVSVRGHDRAVEVLREKGALPRGVSDNVTKVIPVEAKEKVLKPKVAKTEVAESDEEEEVEEVGASQVTPVEAKEKSLKSKVAKTEVAENEKEVEEEGASQRK